MKQKFRLLILVIPIILVIATVSYAYIRRHSDLEETLQRYRDGLMPVKTRDNNFYPEGQLAYYDSLAEAHPGRDRIASAVQIFRAITLMQLGREKDAIGGLEDVIRNTEMEHRDPLFADAQKSLALAYLRLGERNNCISNHASGSCIFPIQGKGIYTDPAASEKAIKGYEAVLRQKPTDLDARWLLNIAYMTIGQYPGKVPPDLLIPGLDKDSSDYKVKPFTDISVDLGLNRFRSQAGGSIVDDFNNDGYLDVVTSSWDLEESMHYFRNNGDGTFTDVSKQSGLADIKGGLNIIQADYNNDGFTDILVCRGAWLREAGRQPKTLLRNNGDGTFTDVTVQSGILSFSPTQTATWADFNNDGWVDLFIGNESLPGAPPHPAELYINNQDGTFTNVADQAGCDAVFFMKGVTSGDYNKDGWPDIFISGLDGRKMLLRNKGVHSKIPQFEDVTREAGLDKHLTFTFPTWFFDYDNDGWPDIFVCGYAFKGPLAATAAAEALHVLPADASKMYLYHNNHDGTFTEVTREMGLDRPVFAMGANFGDIDNDGWPDMYLGTGNPDFGSLIPNKMFKNIGGQKFADVTASARVGNLQKGHGVAFADIDNDGDQDIFIEVGGAYKSDGYYNSLYLNPGQADSNNWVSLLLKGTQSNHSAIGAHIEVYFREDGVKRSVYMDVTSGGSFGGNPFRKEIGIGKAKMIDELVIRWPTSGVVQTFKDVAPREFLTIEEGRDKLVKQELRRLVFGPKQGMGNMDMSMKVDCGPGK